MNDVAGLCPLQQPLAIGSYVKMLVRRVLSDRYRITQEQFQYQGVEISITFRAHTLHKSLVIGSYAKMLVREVLSDRYRITQEEFQYDRVEI